jgi:tetratricopeptide (TPR) repeat protein
MKKLLFALTAATLALSSSASWYWPFGSSDDDSETAEKRRPRLSEMMEPASLLIDEATDLAEDGKSTEAVEKYREALKKLDEIERDNPGLSDKPEFATIRNKRAYVNATIDSLLLMQIKSNARAVAVSDTTELEKKFAAEKAGKKSEAKSKGDATKTKVEKKTETAKVEKKTGRKSAPKASAKKVAKKPLTAREQAMADLAAGDGAAAELAIAELLEAKPDDAAGLNLLAAAKMMQGQYKAAENALDRAISVHPRSHYAYYNMAKLILKTQTNNKSGARRYYETGRDVGGPEDEKLEAALK